MNLPPKPEFSPEGDFLNWIEISTWARHNCRTWADVEDTSKKHKLGELPRLRILCSILLFESTQYRELLIQTMQENPTVKIEL